MQNTAVFSLHVLPEQAGPITRKVPGYEGSLSVSLSPSERFFCKEILENSPVGYLVLTQDWRVAYANPAVCALLDVQGQCFAVNQVLWDVVPELASYFFPWLQQARLRGVPVERGGYYPPRNCWFELTFRPMQEHLVVTIADMTQRQQQLQDLHQGNLYWNQLFESMVDVVIVVDEVGTVLQVNPALKRVFGYQSEELLGENISLLMTGRDKTDHGRYMQQYLKTARSKIMGVGREVKGRHKDGRELHIDLGINEILLKDKRHFVGVLRDISQRRQYEQKIVDLNSELERRVEERTRQLQAVNAELERLALFDTLTGLANRGRFSSMLHYVLTHSQAGDLAFSVIFIDLNGFKAVNDNFGHHVGDLLLKEVGRRTVKHTRESDIVARIGGDEFAILLEKTTRRGAEAVAQKLADAFSEPFELDTRYVACGCGIGIAVYPIHGTSVEELCRHADIAMYNAKQAGATFVTYEPGMTHGAVAAREQSPMVEQLMASLEVKVEK